MAPMFTRKLRLLNTHATFPASPSVSEAEPTSASVLPNYSCTAPVRVKYSRTTFRDIKKKRKWRARVHVFVRRTSMVQWTRSWLGECPPLLQRVPFQRSVLTVRGILLRVVDNSKGVKRLTPVSYVRLRKTAFGYAAPPSQKSWNIVSVP